MPKPWEPDDEHRLFHEALEQIVLALPLVGAGGVPGLAAALRLKESRRALADDEIPVVTASVKQAVVNR